MAKQNSFQIGSNKITETVFQINIPHFYQRQVNVYVLLGNSIKLVDTGHLHKSSFSLLEKALLDLGFSFKDIKYIIYTHPHIDHLGGGLILNDLNKEVINVSYSGAVKIFKNYSQYQEKFIKTSDEFFETKGNGAPYFLIEYAKDFFKNYNYCTPYKGFTINIPVEDKQIIRLEDINLQILHTPSHTPWDISVYEPTDGILFTGDFILEKSVSLFSYITGSDVDNYLSSLKKVKKFDLKTILPSHGRAIENPYQAIEKSIGEIYRTENKILKLLRKKRLTVHQLTSFLLNGKATDPDFWYRYLGMVDTFLTKLLKEGKVYRMIEKGKALYYSRSG
jgi:glyoxylase-like metal-dependent hydrolase (beta-lactamase superfamily II)